MQAMLVALLMTQALNAAPATLGMPCADLHIQALRSHELQSLRDADQARADQADRDVLNISCGSCRADSPIR